MRIPPFEMERWQSTYEHRVRYNLSESGVHPFTLRELLELTGTEAGDLLLEYSQSNGADDLRAAIAALYEGADSDNVLVTTGGAEANFLVMWGLVSAGDRVVVLEPTYGQTPGLARGLGADVISFHLEESLGWQPAPDAAIAAIREGTRLVVVTNPNNPTGAVLSEEAAAEIVRAAERVGAWLLVDEVYAGAELSGDETQTLWGRYERVVCTNSLSKAYGLPGLRLGWVVAPPELIERMWAQKDYLTIATTALSQRLAAEVLAPEIRGQVFQRTRGIIRTNLATLSGWLEARGHVFSFLPPAAGAICYIRYSLPIGSSVLAERLRTEQEVLVVPGDHFGMDGYVRIGFGSPNADLTAALDRIGSLVESAQPAAAGL